MKNKKYLLLIFIMIMFITTINSVLAASTDSQYYANNDSGKYKVLKIKSVNNILIIYAKKNDTVFKILSKKEKIIDHNYKKIRCNREYFYNLKSLFPKYFLGEMLPPPGTTGRMGIIYNGIGVPLETNKGIWDLFEATNLKGLYIEKEDIVSD